MSGARTIMLLAPGTCPSTRTTRDAVLEAVSYYICCNISRALRHMFPKFLQSGLQTSSSWIQYLRRHATIKLRHGRPFRSQRIFA